MKSRSFAFQTLVREERQREKNFEAAAAAYSVELKHPIFPSFFKHALIFFVAKICLVIT